MNLLIITPHLPYPLNSGGNQAQFHFIEYMRNNININILYNENHINSVSNQRRLQEIWPNVKFFPYNWKKEKDKYSIIIRKVVKMIDKKIFNGILQTRLLPFEELCPSLYNFVQNTIKEQQIDLVEIDFDAFLPLIQVLPPKIITVFVQHEIQFVRNERSNFHPLSSEQIIYESLKSQEISCMNKFNAIITLTDIDKKKLIENHVGVPIYSSPACVSSESIKKGHLYTNKNLAFIGGMNHYPNYQGINWFLENVWLLLQKENPNITLSIIGKWEKQTQKKICNLYAGIHFLGFVDDLNKVLNNSVMIVPILIGSGMRMKIVEAANHSCPFVTTTIGVEGLYFKDQEECFIADTPIEFAQNILKLLSNRELQMKQAKAIKKRFEENYSIQILGQKRFSILNSIYNE